MAESPEVFDLDTDAGRAELVRRIGPLTEKIANNFKQHYPEWMAESPPVYCDQCNGIHGSQWFLTVAMIGISASYATTQHNPLPKEDFLAMASITYDQAAACQNLTKQ